MTQALGQLLGSGAGIALSPIPIIAVILMLGTPRWRSSSAAFALGWVAGLVLVTTLVLVLAEGDESTSTADDGVNVSSMVIGALFLALAFRQWRRRPTGGAEPELPAWMAKIDALSALACFGLGAAFSGVNPKNLALTVRAGVALAETGANTVGTVAGVGLLVVVGSVTVVGPVVGSLLAASRVEPVLAGAKTWMIRHNATVMIALFTALGVSNLGDGISSLIS